MAGGTPILIPAIGVCDGIAMGHIGMKYSLASRELIADSVETMTMAHQLDGLVLIPNCDKIVPGMVMAAVRMNIPAVVCSGGPMMSGIVKNEETSLSKMFEAVGARKADIIDDAELARVQAEYPVIWKNKDAKPKLCFVGCPHMSLQQLIDWTQRVEEGLKASGNKKVLIPTVFTTAPAVKKEFEKTEYAARLAATGVVLSYICPLMYMNNPLCGSMPVITCSNKLRTYTTARYYTEEEILKAITKGGK